MSRRSKISKKVSKKIFAKTGMKTNLVNVKAVPMRGGYRI